MAENSGQERTEEATPKRKSDARKKGEVLRSKELTTFFSLTAAGVGLLLFGGQLISDLMALFQNHLSFDKATAFTPGGLMATMKTTMLEFSLLLAPFLLLMLLTMTLGQFLLGGFVMNFSLLAPKLERIDPAKGLGRMFSMRSLVELVKALGKFFLVAGAVIFIISLILGDILRLPTQSLESSLAVSGNLLVWCFLGFSAALILVVCLDVPYQIHAFNKKLKMTKQEIRDEMKETEGRPEIKSAIREKQQEFSRARMMSAVPTADVVITNPTHYAVALNYDMAGSQAPIVVAKGADLVAARIREVAAANDVTVFSAPPLARALYASTEIDQQIPENLFLAVAQVLAYVFQLRDGGARRRKPAPPTDLPVPQEYDDLIKRRGN